MGQFVKLCIFTWGLKILFSSEGEKRYFPRRFFEISLSEFFNANFEGEKIYFQLLKKGTKIRSEDLSSKEINLYMKKKYKSKRVLD